MEERGVQVCRECVAGQECGPKERNNRWRGRSAGKREAGVEIRRDNFCKKTRSSESDKAPEPLVMWKVVSCGGRERWGTKLDFGSGKPFNDHHRTAAVGAEPEVVHVGSHCWFWLERLS